MKAVLVFSSQRATYSGQRIPVAPPLGLLYIGAVLRDHGMSVVLVDADAECVDHPGLAERLERERPDIVGISLLTPSFRWAMTAARTAKRVSGAMVIVGGPHPTVDADSCMTNEAVDIAVRGEGEAAIADICEQLRRPNPDMGAVPGLSYRRGRRVIHTARREPPTDLDALPFPDFGLVADLCRYAPINATRRPIAPMTMTRGCTGCCTFCCADKLFGRGIRTRSVGNVVEEMVRLSAQFGVREVHFVDDCFAHSRGQIRRLSSRVKERGLDLTFSVWATRADMVDEEMVASLSELGVRHIGFGIESADRRILARAAKGISPEHVARAVRLARRAGITTWGYFIVGLPGETARTVKRTVSFARRIGLDYARFSILKPFPGTRIYDQLLTRGLLLNDPCRTYEAYGCYSSPVHRLPGMQPRQIESAHRNALLAFYFRPTKLARLLLRRHSRPSLLSLWRATILMLSIIWNSVWRRDR